MNELDFIEQRVDLENKLKIYTGIDRVILAEEKKIELEEARLTKPLFSARTQIPGLDECVDGFRRGQLVVVSGPPKQGKTLLCQNFTKRFTEQKLRCLWFSYEVGYEELFEKFPMELLDFYIPNQLQSGNLEWIETKIIESKVKYATDVVFIDHLDFLRDTRILSGVSFNLSSYIGGIVQKLKSIAIEQNILTFLMSHIRKNQWTTNDLPSSEELRDSGQIAQLADIVIMIVRRRAEKGTQSVYEGTRALVGVIENRLNGRTKKIPIELRGKEFVEITNVYDAEGNDQNAGNIW